MGCRGRVKGYIEGTWVDGLSQTSVKLDNCVRGPVKTIWRPGQRVLLLLLLPLPLHFSPADCR